MNLKLQSCIELIEPAPSLEAKVKLFTAKCGNVKLAYFGATHSYEPSHPQYPLLESAFENADPDAVIIEGILQFSKILVPDQFCKLETYFLSLDPNEAIRLGGESSYVVRKALQKGAFIWCPELSFSERVIFLDQRFPNERERIVAFHLPIWRDYWFSRNGGVIWDDLLERQLNTIRTETRWEVEKAKAEQAFLSETGETIDSLSSEEIKRVLRPDSTTFRDFRAVVSRAREEAILHSIYSLLRGYRSVFVCYGKSHLARTENALRFMTTLF